MVQPRCHDTNRRVRPQKIQAPIVMQLPHVSSPVAEITRTWVTIREIHFALRPHIMLILPLTAAEYRERVEAFTKLLTS